MTNGAEDNEEFVKAAMQALDAMRRHSVEMTELVHTLNAENQLHREQITNLGEAVDNNARVANSNAEIANENQASVDMERDLAARKEIISHLFEKSHQYVTVVVAGGFAAYFATLSAVSTRLSDVELKWSALLMTISLTIFILWEVGSITFVGYHTTKGDYGFLKEVPRWQRWGWVAALTGTLLTALPAIGLSIYAYVRGLT